MNKRPIIIDCDPGVDDAICIFMMLGNSAFDVLGITPVCGNKHLADCEANALRLCELTGKTEIPVLRGAKKAMFRKARTSGNIHGETGLGGVVLPEPEKRVEKQYAWDFIYEKAVEHSGALELLAVGPLTNLGIAFLKYPDLKDHIKQIVIMGGGITLGNMSASGEFNIWADPDSAHLVFTSGVPIVMVGLEICREPAACVHASDVARLKSLDGPVSNVAAQLIGERVARWEHSGAILCDAVAAAYLIDASVITEIEDAYVDVETGGGITDSRTIAWRGELMEKNNLAPNTKICWQIDHERYIDFIYDSCKNLDESLR